MSASNNMLSLEIERANSRNEFAINGAVGDIRNMVLAQLNLGDVFVCGPTVHIDRKLSDSLLRKGLDNKKVPATILNSANEIVWLPEDAKDGETSVLVKDGDSLKLNSGIDPNCLVYFTYVEIIDETPSENGTKPNIGQVRKLYVSVFDKKVFEYKENETHDKAVTTKRVFTTTGNVAVAAQGFAQRRDFLNTILNKARKIKVSDVTIVNTKNFSYNPQDSESSLLTPTRVFQLDFVD